MTEKNVYYFSEAAMDHHDYEDSNSLTPITSTNGREYVNMSVLSVYQSAEDLLAGHTKAEIVSSSPAGQSSSRSGTNSSKFKVNGEDLGASPENMNKPNSNNRKDYSRVSRK